MGKKRRIKSSNKYTLKHSTHPAATTTVVTPAIVEATPTKTKKPIVAEVDPTVNTNAATTAPKIKVTETTVKNTTKKSVKATIKKTKSTKKKTS